MKNARMQMYYILYLLFILLFITSCSSSGKLNEGDCICTVQVPNVPDELTLLNDVLYKNISFNVVLQNVTTEKKYSFVLSPENDFLQTATLNPGIYKVFYCQAKVPSSLISIELTTDIEQLELSREHDFFLPVTIENQNDLIAFIKNMVPSQEILNADMFSRKIQLDGHIIDLENIIDYGHFKSDKSLISAYEKFDVVDNSLGIIVTLLNPTSEQIEYNDCKVIKVEFTKANAILGKGVMIGTASSEIFHVKNGVYGAPDSMSGNVLIGSTLDVTEAYYFDNMSGDKLTLEISSTGEYITNIIYEFAVFAK